MKESDLKEKDGRGKLADQLLSNPLHKEAFDSIEGVLWAEFKKTKFAQSDERDEIWRKIQSLQWVQQHYERIVRDGDKARATLLERMKLRVING